MGVPYKDKRKQRDAQARSYIRNRTKAIESAWVNRNERRKKLTKIARDAKDHPCTDCGISYPYYVMDFDHVRGDKVGAIGYMVNETVPVDVLLAEIAKCEVVCSNCHRKRTHAGKDNPMDGDGTPLEAE